MPVPSLRVAYDTCERYGRRVRWQEVQQQLLPKSGVAVVAPWLVIAPAGNPVIRLDLRLLDHVEIRPESEDDDPDDVDAERHRLCEVVLTCGELDVGLYIADGPEAAARIVSAAAPLTRSGSKSEAPPLASPSHHADPIEVSAKLIIMSSTADAKSTLNDELAGKVFELSKESTFIGRAEDNDIVIEHDSISRTHAKVTRDATTGGYCITNLQSTNGVRVNGEEQISIELEDGDIVDLGHVRKRFESREDVISEEAGPASLDRFLTVGKHSVVHRDNFILVGDRAFRVEEVQAYALQSANLPLTKNRLLQAAITLLVVAAGGSPVKCE